VRALVSAVAGFLGVFVAVPIQGEQILTALPGAVFGMHAHTAFLQAIKGGAGDFVAEAIPELEPIQRSERCIELVTEGVKRQPPDDRAVVRENVEAKSVAFYGGDAEDADIYELAMMRKTVVEEFLAKETVDS